MDKEFGRLARDLMTEAGVTEARRHHRRGFFAGIKFLLDTPTFEAGALERALKESDTS